ncbi:uncharacterized protein LOC133183167 [Saccostrea echinata]|uniref:uncharacterized protein LOC133183167 n=1 Tax=Saccostrea echinata TaxID=191078 RepID=UPI002A827F5D|nr:uncharacterized protein LOC133183167 [Saccostrea echinata]
MQWTPCMRWLWILIVVIFYGLPRTKGHGYLVEPPQRSSLWRHGLGPDNYNDNALNCGGFKRHWTQNGGKCGICGDAYDLLPPRPNEDGGFFGKGVVIRTYRSGEDIDVVVNLTANHLGWMEFKLCSHDNSDQPVTQECLDKNVLRILPNNKGKRTVKRFYVGKQKLISLRIKLPSDFSCKKCVLQWKYNAGNSWGCGDSGCGIGLGPQEQFYNCADISILKKIKIIQKDSTEDSEETDNKKSSEDTSEISDEDMVSKLKRKGSGKYIDMVKNKANQMNCRPTKRWRSVPGMIQWCLQSCPKCPTSHCKCEFKEVKLLNLLV